MTLSHTGGRELNVNRGHHLHLSAEIQLDSRLVVVSDSPLNAETPLGHQRGIITPTSLFFLRNRFSVPELSTTTWCLTVDGEVRTSLHLQYRDLLALPHRTLIVTLECAGNGRSGLSPLPQGEPWGYGAVSTAEWTGVPLTAVLQGAGVLAGTREVVFEGADRGAIAGRKGAVPFARSLPLEKALHPDTLLAFAMNGEMLPVEHGYPLRLIVPGWYGMASVKWLSRITAVGDPFDGFFQTSRYVLGRTRPQGPAPLAETRVRSVMVQPIEGEELPLEPIRLAGYAWSGGAPISLVEVSTDGGESWRPAHWTTGEQRYAWRRWEFRWPPEAPGEVILQSRARDAAGKIQPAVGEWNELGYANNAVQSVRVCVRT